METEDRTLETAAPIDVLLENHRTFLRYLERRTGDRARAENILQDAFARTLAKPGRVPNDEPTPLRLRRMHL